MYTYSIRSNVAMNAFQNYEKGIISNGIGFDPTILPTTFIGKHYILDRHF